MRSQRPAAANTTGLSTAREIARPQIVGLAGQLPGHGASLLSQPDAFDHLPDSMSYPQQPGHSIAASSCPPASSMVQVLRMVLASVPGIARNIALCSLCTEQSVRLAMPAALHHCCQLADAFRVTNRLAYPIRALVSGLILQLSFRARRGAIEPARAEPGQDSMYQPRSQAHR